jgi:hypothetical protein
MLESSRTAVSEFGPTAWQLAGVLSQQHQRLGSKIDRDPSPLKGLSDLNLLPLQCYCQDGVICNQLGQPLNWKMGAAISLYQFLHRKGQSKRSVETAFVIK